MMIEERKRNKSRYDGHAVLIPADIGIPYFVFVSGHDFKGHTFITVIEHFNRSGCDILKNDGVACIQPAKQKTGYTKQDCISNKHIAPYGFPQTVGNIQCNKIRTTG